jgi:autotransporter strand-loop-strand O-heptosyltransferase
MKEQLIDIYENSKRSSKPYEPKVTTVKESMDVHFVGQPFVDIFGDNPDGSDYKVEFIDKSNNAIIYTDTVKLNHWLRVNRKWFTDYQIKVYKNDKPLYIYNYNAKGKRVYVHLDSKSLGDTIAWFPYVEEFRKKHQCKMICSTFWNDFFIQEYPEIEFVKPGAELDSLYAMYTIGINPDDKNKNKNDYRTIPLQQVASDMLGLDFFEVRPKISVPKRTTKILKKPYVCISKHSTALAKYWNNPTGWQETVDYLVSKGYNVVSVAKEGCDLDNVTVINDGMIQDVTNILDGCKFFVGLPSGLAWLAWALGKKVVMICGFSKPWYEFTENNYYVQNDDPNLCTGCFVDPKVEFDKGDWNWCPYHKNTLKHFECTKKITSQMAIEKINEIIENKKLNIDLGILSVRDSKLLLKEFEIDKIYNKYFQPKDGDIIVDMGACIGFYPVFLLKDIDFKVCYCIEPFPKNLSVLKRNISTLKNRKNIKIVKYAINDDIEDGSFAIDSNWTAPIKETSEETDIKINVMKFIEFIDKYKIKHIDILKMDIEGSEYSILSKRDNLEMIKDRVVNITGEIHFNPLNDNQKTDIVESFLFLKENGYNVIFTSVDGFDITKNIFENGVIAGGTQKSFDYYNQFLFYCIKEK